MYAVCSAFAGLVMCLIYFVVSGLILRLHVMSYSCFSGSDSNFIRIFIWCVVLFCVIATVS